MVDTARTTITVPGADPDKVVDPFGAEDGLATQEPPGRGAGAPAGRRGRGPFPGARRGGGGGGRSSGGEAAGGRIDLRNTWQILAGSILVPLGVVFILMAWYGASHTAYVQQQIPYLVSGSFAGVGCLVLGGLLYWAHWLYRIYDQADLHHQEQLQVLEHTLRAIGERTGSAGTLSPPSGAGQLPTPPSYVVTPTGSVYHLPDCPVVAHHPAGLRSVAPVQVADLEPCRICLAGDG